MFELLNPTEAKLVDVRVLSQKNRELDEDPGAKLVLQISLENYVLNGFDPALKACLFTAQQAIKKAEASQAELDGVEPVSDTPNLSGIGAHIGVLRWTQEMTGYTLTVELGLGGRKSNLLIFDCKLSHWRLTPEQGGTVVVKCDLESQHISDAAWAKLAKLKSRKITVTLRAPVVAAELLDAMEPAKPEDAKAFYDGANNPFRSTDAAEAKSAGHKPKPLKAGAKPVSPTDAFVTAHGQDTPR